MGALRRPTTVIVAKAVFFILNLLRKTATVNESTIQANEVGDAKEPDKSVVKKYLEVAKNSMATAALGFEATEAAKKLFELFGLS